MPASSTVISLRKLHDKGIVVAAINVHLLRDYHKFALRLSRAGASEFELGPEGDGAGVVLGEQRVRFSLEELFRAEMVSHECEEKSSDKVELIMGCTGLRLTQSGEREVRLGYLVVRTRELLSWLRSQSA